MEPSYLERIEQTMRPREIASILDVTYSDVFYLIRIGQLKATRFGKNGRFVEVDTESVYQELERRQKAALDPIEPPNPSGYCLCGCGSPVSIAKRDQRTRGTKAGHSLRYLPGHHPNGWALSDKRFIVDPVSGCWIWQRSKTPEGYPKLMRVDGIRYAPHRYYYQQKYGPIPDGYALDHLCKTRLCVNPDHLQPVTQTENTRRSSIAKLTTQDAANIKGMFAQGYSKRRLARMFSVTPSTIADLVNGVTWKDVVST